MSNYIRITKNEAIRKVPKVKNMLVVLHKMFPGHEGQCNFYAYFSNVNGFFWVGVTDYWIWSNAKFTKMFAAMEKAARADGYSIVPMQVHPVGKMQDKREALKRNTMFIEIKQDAQT